MAHEHVVLSDGKNYIQLGDVLVEEKSYHIAKKIKEYDPNLDLICLEPGQIQLSSAPFMVVAREPNGTYTKVLEAWELDDRILERIWACDQHRFDTLTTIEAWEERNRKLSESRYKEAMAENNELMEAVIKNQKSTFTFENKEGDMVKLHDQKPATKNNEKKTFSG